MCCRLREPTGAATTAAVTLRTALDEAVRDLARRFGDDPARWRWGEAHPAVFAHPMLRRLPISGALSTFSVAKPRR